MAVLTAIGLYLLAFLLVAAGISHFMRPRFYTRMLPLWMPGHRLLVGLTGIIEVALGVLLLFPGTRSHAAWATIVMLAGYLLVHIHMLFDVEAGMGLPSWVLWLRLLLQFLLIAWAYQYV